LWEHNFFTSAHVWLQSFVTNLFVRGAVTGIGLITVLCGLRDLAGALLARPPFKTEPPAPTSNIP
jgi:hypothetical protein